MWQPYYYIIILLLRWWWLLLIIIINIIVIISAFGPVATRYRGYYHLMTVAGARKRTSPFSYRCRAATGCFACVCVATASARGRSAADARVVNGQTSLPRSSSSAITGSCVVYVVRVCRALACLFLAYFTDTIIIIKYINYGDIISVLSWARALYTYRIVNRTAVVVFLFGENNIILDKHRGIISSIENNQRSFVRLFIIGIYFFSILK